MTKANQHMTAAIDHAISREAEIYATKTRIISGHCSGWTETHIGELKVNFIVAQGATTRLPQHMRKSWRLNGKVIATSKLEKLLNA